MQDSKTSKFEERASHWREIISRADQYPGSHYAFCVKEGIAKGPFYYWKKKLTRSKGKKIVKVASPFAAVEVVNPIIARTNSRQSLIDAGWVADLILHLHGGAR